MGVLLMMRHPSEPWAGKAAAISHDGGSSWGPTQLPWGRPDVCPDCRSTLASPNCQASITTFAGTTYYSGANSTNHQRVRLVVRRSQDNAATWDDGLLIDPGPSGYSCLVSAPLAKARNCSSSGCGGVLYESADTVMRFVRFPLRTSEAVDI